MTNRPIHVNMRLNKNSHANHYYIQSNCLCIFVPATWCPHYHHGQLAHLVCMRMGLSCTATCSNTAYHLYGHTLSCTWCMKLLWKPTCLNAHFNYPYYIIGLCMRMKLSCNGTPWSSEIPGAYQNFFGPHMGQLSSDKQWEF